ncbi:cytochrome P450 [Annulohypoxylon maeteangense]|uniref:cytochrome P450 n=1 Tax=Annulohypoxylon maeteangense TaxID=1927788 RepID=UPI002008D636|nr:cytochrome P450 [Annulohypoxylon maeteangense]KAI0880264.1 cytochrome P450 [Annulohypoxylon maeteangense]
MLKPILFAVLTLLITYLYRRLHYKRFQQHGRLPQMPPSLLFGHLKTLDGLIKRGEADRHPDIMFTEMHEALGRPSLMFVDLRPVNRPLVLISSHEIAEQVSKPSKLFPASLPKTDLSYLLHLTGPTSILLSHGEPWKALRKRYNPAFAPQHLMSLLPCVLEKTSSFIRNLDALACSGEEFSLVTLAINLTFDIIGAVVMDVDLDAQPLDVSRQGELVRLYVELFREYWDDKADMPWWLIPKIEMKRRRLGKRIDQILKDIIHRKHAEHQAKGHGDNQSRSILSLSLRDTKTLSPELVNETCDQIKTFLLAGHDTTSITLSWVCYWLSRTPRALAAVRSELDNLLGHKSDMESVYARLLSPEGPDLVHRMTYISAVLKETLRLHPPAATARYSKPGTGFTVHTPEGGDHCLDGMIIYNCEGLIQRDPAIYGDLAEYFVPERWLGDVDIPASAWRPFERGPRNCIGQEFAMIEIRVIVAAIARRFDFTKIGLGELALDEKNQPMLDGNGIYKIKSLLYNTRQVNAKPVDGMRMKVNLAPDHDE